MIENKPINSAEACPVLPVEIWGEITGYFDSCRDFLIVKNLNIAVRTYFAKNQSLREIEDLWKKIYSDFEIPIKFGEDPVEILKIDKAHQKFMAWRSEKSRTPDEINAKREELDLFQLHGQYLFGPKKFQEISSGENIYIQPVEKTHELTFEVDAYAESRDHIHTMSRIVSLNPIAYLIGCHPEEPTFDFQDIFNFRVKEADAKPDIIAFRELVFTGAFQENSEFGHRFSLSLRERDMGFLNRLLNAVAGLFFRN